MLNGPRSRPPLPPAAVGLLLVATALAVPLRAQERRTSSVSADRLAELLAGDVPADRAELRAMQAHFQALLERVLPCTIAIGAASGVLVEDGVALTAGHVVRASGRQVRVTLHDGRTLSARTLGLDDRSDAGLVRLTGDQELPSLPMGSSADVRPGQWCLMLGHPAGPEKGRSAPVRLGRVLAVRRDWIVTDCTMCAGDSGGPLVDMQGRVIGVNSRISQNLASNMHVPIDAFHAEWQSLVAGKVIPASRERTSGGAGRSDGAGASGRVDRALAAASFADSVAAARRSTVRVLAAGKPVALGTVVDASGLVVTKASEVGDALECELGNGHRVAAAVVALDEDADLALLRVEARDLVAVEWDEEAVPLPGAWVASAGPGRQPLAIGAVSVAARRPAARAVRRNTLRVELASDRDRARVRAVPDGSSAARAGLLPGDVIVRVADWPVHSARSLGRALAKKSKGERVEVSVQRGDESLVLEAEVEETVDRSPRNAQERLWGPLSTVRAGFAEVLQHDTVLRPEDCGGPLVDVDGRVVGLNIARSGRVESLALPARHVRDLVASLLASAR